MKIICSYCRTSMGEKPPLEDPAPTHSICAACEAKLRSEWGHLRLSDQLDQIAEPVMVVDAQSRVIGLNRPMAQRLGRLRGQVAGLLAGEVTGCVNSGLVKGCGRTAECAGCSLRRAIEKTARTGEEQRRVSVRLRRQRGYLDLTLSTRLLESGVVEVQLIEAAPR